MCYEAIGGSRSYGLELPDSDADLLRVETGPRFAMEGGYNVIRATLAELHDWLRGRADNAYYLQWLFPAEVHSDTILTRWLQGNREEIVRAQLPYIYRVFSGHADRLFPHSDWLYPARPKRLAYCTLFYSVAANYAEGMSFAEAHRPGGKLHDTLLSMRQGGIPLADAMARCSAERERAGRAAGFYQRPVDEVVLLEMDHIFRAEEGT